MQIVRKRMGSDITTHMNPLNVLISLHQGYGLGDAVQMSAVLRHVVKHRPHWQFDFQAEAGKEKVGAGMAQTCFRFGEKYPRDHYDVEVQILLYDMWANFGDRPNTRVSSALHERFGLDWDAECGRYWFMVPPDDWHAAQEGFAKFSAMRPRLDTRMVAVHYRGDSSPAKKNLSDEQVDQVCDKIIALGRCPLLLDWRDTFPLSNRRDVCTTGRECFSKGWGADAAMNVAIISMCEAFVGIDSGPSKCASVTNTPALVVWTGHHPAPFHDPAPNTTHLVPRGYHGLEPVVNDIGVIKFFESNYNVIQYDRDPVAEVNGWLGEVLK